MRKDLVVYFAGKWFQRCDKCNDDYRDNIEEPIDDWTCELCVGEPVDDPTSIMVEVTDDDGYVGRRWAREKMVINLAYGIREGSGPLAIDYRSIFNITIHKRRDREFPTVEITEHVRPSKRVVAYEEDNDKRT